MCVREMGRQGAIIATIYLRYCIFDPLAAVEKIECLFALPSAPSNDKEFGGARSHPLYKPRPQVQ